MAKVRFTQFRSTHEGEIEVHVTFMAGEAEFRILFGRDLYVHLDLEGMKQLRDAIDKVRRPLGEGE